MTHDVLIAFGANLGDGESVFGEVKKRLERDFVQVRGASLLRTRAVTLAKLNEDEPDYWNSVFRLRVSETWTPTRFLEYLLNLEREFGRIRKGKPHWSSRPLDLDLLLWDSLFWDEAPRLILPHPMMAWRDFVLEPACEIASEWIHPVTHSTLGEMFQALKTNSPHLVPLVWESPSPVPPWLLEEAGKSHRSILAYRWICRNEDSKDILRQVVELVTKAPAEENRKSETAPDCL